MVDELKAWSEEIAYKKGKIEGVNEFVKYIDKHSHISVDGTEVCLDDDITILAEQFLGGGQ